MNTHLSTVAQSAIFTLLLVAVVGLWSMIFGQMSATVVPKSALEDLHRDYNHLTMYEDGSYTGQSITGERISGCVRGALCDKTELHTTGPVQETLTIERYHSTENPQGGSL